MWSPEPLPRRRAGMSLVEVIFAVGILGIAIIGIMATMLATIRHREAARETEVASNAAEERLEMIRGTTFADIPTTYHNIPFDVTGLKVHPTNTGGCQGGTTVTTLAANLLEVQVTIEWPAATGALQTVVLQSQIFDNTP